MPQSNQRGIETWRGRAPGAGRIRGLNRTSVGLKQGSAAKRHSRQHGLNRTSVGLKPCSASSWSSCGAQASIEPAWD